MTNKEKFDNRDLQDMTKSQCLSDLDTIRRVFENPDDINKEDIGAYRTMYGYLGKVLNILLIAKGGDALDQIDYDCSELQNRHIELTEQEFKDIAKSLWITFSQSSTDLQDNFKVDSDYLDRVDDLIRKFGK